MNMATHQKHYDTFERRIYIIAMGIGLALCILGIRLWDLQVVKYEYYRGQAEYNRLHAQRLEAPRGIIYGRDESTVLADNRPSCDLVIVPAECVASDLKMVCDRLARLISIDAGELLKKIEANRKAKPYLQIVVKQDVSKDELTRVEESSHALPGVFTVVRPQRRYLMGKTAGQIMGYLNEIGDKEVKDQYQYGDLVGRTGLERMYESNLRGEDGKLVVNVYAEDRGPQLRTDAFGNPFIGVDSRGRKLEQEMIVYPTRGRSLFLTLDIGLQRYCERILEEKGQVGAIVVLNADTGEVLALASAPNYDPNAFVIRDRKRDRTEALTSKPSTMTNRGYREAYAPGSIFKVLLASAALEEGVIDEHTTFNCPGYFQLASGGRRWGCWSTYGHGGMNVVDALAYSCDVFFYNVGTKLKIDRIKKWTDTFGLGQKTGIDLPAEVKGLIPSREWKKQLEKERTIKDGRWYEGDTVNLSIGQGEAWTTPLQNAVLMAAIVNGGRRVQPFLVRKIDDQVVEPKISEPFLSEKTLNIVRMGMRKCVEKGPPAPTGTGNLVRMDGFTILGKTGTAQVAGMEKYKGLSEEQIPEKYRSNAWFVAGVLDREPRIAICVLIEHGLHGNSTASPFAKDVIQYFYSPHDSNTPGDNVVTLAKEEKPPR